MLIGSNSFVNSATAVNNTNSPEQVELMNNMYGFNIDPGAATIGIVAADQALQLGIARVLTGAGTPEGTVSGNIGDLFLRSDGAAGTTGYLKESGAGTNTGWSAFS